MNLKSLINHKTFYRITGTPENFLTALRYSTWGFNDTLVSDWNKLLPGDIIFFHSKGEGSKFFKKLNPCVIGFGVAGANFFIKRTPLWIDEKIDQLEYPYRFNFSEIYLFNKVDINSDWDSASLDKEDATKKIIEGLVKAGIPLGNLNHGEGNRFPHMGSYSRINSELVKDSLLSSIRKLYFYEGVYDTQELSKKEDFKEISNNEEIARYSKSLTVFDDIKEMILKESGDTYRRNIELLSKATSKHYQILKCLKEKFETNGFKVFNNVHVDLFAHNDNTSYLIEAKSTENRNFKTQSRKAIIQLLEYNYFEVSKYKFDNRIEFEFENRVLATSNKPNNSSYIDFINSLGIKTLAVENNSILKYGQSISLDL